MMCLFCILAELVVASEPTVAQGSAAGVRIAVPFPEFMLGPIVSDSAGKCAALTGVSYTRSDDGYAPSLVVWNLGAKGVKTGEFQFKLPEGPRKSTAYPFLAACRWENGDIALITLLDDYRLLRLNARGELVYMREPEKTPKWSESFAAIVPDRNNGLWLGTGFNGRSRLYHLDGKGEVLLKKGVAFDQFTSIAQLAQPMGSDGVLACGASSQLRGAWQSWVARIKPDGEVAKKASIPGEAQLSGLEALPGGGAVVLQFAAGKDQGTVKVWVFDKDLEVVKSTSWTAPGVDMLRVSMSVVGNTIVVLTQGKSSHRLVELDRDGQMKAEHRLATGVIPSPWPSLAVVGEEVLIAGRPENSDGSIRTSDLEVETYQIGKTK